MKMTLKAEIPCFPGFYESHLYSYEDDERAAELVIENFTDKFFDFPAEVLRAFLRDAATPERYAMVLDLPAYHKAAQEEFCEQLECLSYDRNMDRWPVTKVTSTTSGLATIELDPDAIHDEIYARLYNFERWLKDRDEADAFADYVNPEYWELSPRTIGALLEFLILDQLGDDAAYIISERVKNYASLMDYYAFPEIVSDWLETEEAEEIAAEYQRVKAQCESYVAVMGDKYRPTVDAHMVQVIANLVEDMQEKIEQFEEEN